MRWPRSSTRRWGQAMRKLNAVVDASGEVGVLIVTVTDMDTKEEYVLTIEAKTEKEAAFKAMEQINDQ